MLTDTVQCHGPVVNLLQKRVACQERPKASGVDEDVSHISLMRVLPSRSVEMAALQSYQPLDASLGCESVLIGNRRVPCPSLPQSMYFSRSVKEG
jgi:hypothetical protein